MAILSFHLFVSEIQRYDTIQRGNKCYRKQQASGLSLKFLWFESKQFTSATGILKHCLLAIPQPHTNYSSTAQLYHGIICPGISNSGPLLMNLNLSKLKNYDLESSFMQVLFCFYTCTASLACKAGFYDHFFYCISYY